jgi:DNA-binding response OmpR family regulator
VELTASEDSQLSAQSFLTRYCKRCHGQTRWHRSEGTLSTFRSEYATPAPPQRASILVIDDDESILTILQKALAQDDHEVQLASSARRAIEFLGRGDYDLILSDIRMPEFDGKQLFAFLDQNMKEYRNKIIFLTGDTANPDTMQFLNSIGASYMPKPLDIPGLVTVVRRLLSMRKRTG